MGTGAVVADVPAGLIPHLQAAPQQVVFVPAQRVGVDRDPPAVASFQENDFGPAIRLVAIADFRDEPRSDLHSDLALLGFN
jgi:hypothetical protein